MEENTDPVYSRNVIEFVAVANDFSKYTEHASELKGDELLKILQRILTQLDDACLSEIPATFLTTQRPDNLQCRFLRFFTGLNVRVYCCSHRLDIPRHERLRFS